MIHYLDYIIGLCILIIFFPLLHITLILGIFTINEYIYDKINKKCIKCDETIIKQVLIGENYQGIYICPLCKVKFIN